MAAASTRACGTNTTTIEQQQRDKHKNNFANNKRHISAARWHGLCMDNCNLEPIQGPCDLQPSIDWENWTQVSQESRQKKKVSQLLFHNISFYNLSSSQFFYVNDPPPPPPVQLTADQKVMPGGGAIIDRGEGRATIIWHYCTLLESWVGRLEAPNIRGCGSAISTSHRQLPPK